MTMPLNARTKAAMRRAFNSAVRTPRLHGTNICVERDGKVVGLNPYRISLRGL